MNASTLESYRLAVTALAPVLDGLPAVVIAIDGLPGAGKTTLGRYLAWTFNVSLIETDTFMRPSVGRPDYLDDALKHVIGRRIELERPVIIEGILIHETLRRLAVHPAFSIYVLSQDQEPGSSFATALTEYERSYRPVERADLVLPPCPDL